MVEEAGPPLALLESRVSTARFVFFLISGVWPRHPEKLFSLNGTGSRAWCVASVARGRGEGLAELAVVEIGVGVVSGEQRGVGAALLCRLPVPAVALLMNDFVEGLACVAGS